MECRSPGRLLGLARDRHHKDTYATLLRVTTTNVIVLSQTLWVLHYYSGGDPKFGCAAAPLAWVGRGVASKKTRLSPICLTAPNLIVVVQMLRASADKLDWSRFAF